MFIPFSLFAVITVACTIVGGEVTVLLPDDDDNNKDLEVAVFPSAAALFGRSLPKDGLEGRLMKADPKNGCGRALKPPPSSHRQNWRWIAAISRHGGCKFDEKVRNAEKGNWSAVIVYNFRSNKLIPMAGEAGDADIIPSVFVGYNDALVLMTSYSYEMFPEYRIVLTDDDDYPFNINAYLLPFAIVVGICFLIMLVLVIYKCVQDARRNRRHRLPRSCLKKLPVQKFKEGDRERFETCCICLDDFVVGDKLRVLPCEHAYHAKCVDPWLIKTKRVCPQCRKKVFESNERGAGLVVGEGSSAQSESGDLSDVTVSDERAPLLGHRRRIFHSRFSRTSIFRRNATTESSSITTAAIERRHEEATSSEDDDLEAVPTFRVEPDLHFAQEHPNSDAAPPPTNIA